MFVTILTIIYLALAVFVLARVIKRKSADIHRWKRSMKLRFTGVIVADKKDMKRVHKNSYDEDKLPKELSSSAVHN